MRSNKKPTENKGGIFRKWKANRSQSKEGEEPNIGEVIYEVKNGWHLTAADNGDSDEVGRLF